MRNRYLLGAGVALAVALSWADAQAQLFAAPGGPGAWYFGGEGGWTMLENQSGATTGGASGLGQSWSDGFSVGARAGYEWGPWRFEEEFRFITNGPQRDAGASVRLVRRDIDRGQRESRRLCVHDQRDL